MWLGWVRGEIKQSLAHALDVMMQLVEPVLQKLFIPIDKYYYRMVRYMDTETKLFLDQILNQLVLINKNVEYLANDLFLKNSSNDNVLRKGLSNDNKG
jgi:hypothetical protein